MMQNQTEEVRVEMHGQLSRATIHEMIDNLDGDAEIQSFRVGIATDDPVHVGLGNGHKEPEETNGTDVRLQLGGDPFVLMQVLAAANGWIRTTELRSAIPTDASVNDESIGSNLWSLAERGLVEKRRCEDDGRQKEYRITDRGHTVLSDAMERAEGEEALEAVADEVTV